MENIVGTSLAPSEVVALRGELFAPAGGALNSWKLVGSENKVSGLPLASSMFAAAFLALEKAGEVHLVKSKKKAALGREVDTVLVTPVENASDWPAGSFEGKIIASARKQQGSGRNNVQAIVFDVLEKTVSGFVPNAALSLAHNSMAKRGLLQVEAKKGLFTGPGKFTLAPAASETLAQSNPAEIQQMLQSFEKDRPDVSQLLNKEIKSGFDARMDLGSDF